MYDANKIALIWGYFSQSEKNIIFILFNLKINYIEKKRQMLTCHLKL